MPRILILCLLFAPVLSALPLNDSEHGFRAEIPDSMPAARIDKARFPNTLHMFAEQERGGAVLQFVLLPEEIPQGASTANGPRDVAVNWKGHSLMRRQRVLSPGTAHAASELFVDVPVVKRGIRIALTGPVKRETELVGLFVSVLERFDAQSNWKTGPDVSNSMPPRPAVIGDEPARESEEGLPHALAGLAVGIAMVLGFAAGWWLRGQGAAAPAAVKPPGTTAIAPSEKTAAPKTEPLPPPSFAAPSPPPKPPDETDPGQPAKCRVCGEPTRPGRKKCMNCGSEIF